VCNTNIVCVSTMPRDKHWQHVNHHHDLGVVCYLFIFIFLFYGANERKSEREKRIEEIERQRKASERERESRFLQRTYVIGLPKP
jgi:hypothetical protein